MNARNAKRAAILVATLACVACETTGYEPATWVPTEPGGQRIFLDAKEFENALAQHLKRVQIEAKQLGAREDLSKFESLGRTALIWIAETGPDYEFSSDESLKERLAAFTLIRDNEIKWGERGTAVTEGEKIWYIKFDHPLVSDNKCFGFGGSWPSYGLGAGDDTTSRKIAGFYCTPMGEDISASKIESFINGIKIKGEAKE